MCACEYGRTCPRCEADEAKYTGPDPRDDERDPNGGSDDGDRHPEA